MFVDRRTVRSYCLAVAWFAAVSPQGVMGQCPATRPNTGDPCDASVNTIDCNYETESCCGQTFPSFTAECYSKSVGDKWLVRVNDHCLGIQEPEDCNCQSGGSCGDPHFQLWTGDWYDFHHTCDLVLLKAPEFRKGAGLQVNIRTTGRYEYSYIEAAAIRIGDDILEVNGWGQYALNGVSGAVLTGATGATMGGGIFPISYEALDDNRKHIFEVPSGLRNEKIVVTTFKDMVSVMVKEATKTNFGNSVGLMGTFGNGTMLARDGITALKDPIEFGLEWQVRTEEEDGPDLFRTARHPQYPTVCDAPGVAKKVNGRNRRLGEAAALNIVTQEAAEQACAHWQEDHIDLCVYDVLATGDLELADAGAY